MKKKRMRKQGQKQGKIEFEAKEWEKVRPKLVETKVKRPSNIFFMSVFAPFFHFHRHSTLPSPTYWFYTPSWLTLPLWRETPRVRVPHVLG